VVQDVTSEKGVVGDAPAVDEPLAADSPAVHGDVWDEAKVVIEEVTPPEALVHQVEGAYTQRVIVADVEAVVEAHTAEQVVEQARHKARALSEEAARIEARAVTAREAERVEANRVPVVVAVEMPTTKAVVLGRRSSGLSKVVCMPKVSMQRMVFRP